MGPGADSGGPKRERSTGQTSLTEAQSPGSRAGASATATYSAASTAFRSRNTRRLDSNKVAKLLLMPHVSTWK